jgi:hypothetical protein
MRKVLVLTALVALAGSALAKEAPASRWQSSTASAVPASRIEIPLTLDRSTGPNAGTITFPTDTGSFDELDSLNNVYFTVDLGVPGGEINGIGWNVQIKTVGASWLSEASLSFDNVDFTDGLFLNPGYGDDFSSATYVPYTSGGILDLAAIDPTYPITLPDGKLYLQLFEGYDDVVNAADGYWAAGSQIQLAWTPEPASLALLALTLVLRRR